jgi:hypothetical protein
MDLHMYAACLLLPLLLPLPRQDTPATPAPASTDIVSLKDGQIVEKVAMNRTEGGILLHYENGDVLVKDELVLDAVLAEDLTKAPANAEEEAQAKNGMVRFEGKWVPIKKRDEALRKRIDDRRKQIADDQLHSEWRNRRTDSSKHIDYNYTIPQHIFVEYKEALEAYLAEFLKIWKLPAPPKEHRLTVNIYSNEKEFFQVAAAGGGTLAYFRWVRPYDLNGYYDRYNPEFAKQVFYHEFTHYLEKLVEYDFSYPHFPNESVAEFYGGSTWDPKTKKFATGLLQEGRLTEIEADIARGEPMPLEKLVTTEGMYQHYTWGWSFVHFAMNTPKYKPKFEKFYMSLSRGKGIKRRDMGIDNVRTVEADEVYRVLKQEFGLKSNEDVRNLEAEWHKYVNGLFARITIIGKEQAGLDSIARRRPLRAKRFLKEAIDMGTRNPSVYYEYARLLATGKDKAYDDAMSQLQKAVELDPLNGRLYFAMSIVEHARDNKDEGNRLEKLAKELGYEDKFINFILGKDDADDGEGEGEGED